ncbi:hypothetical protein PVL29_007480 [Vitis rotundifolia]|uniref:RING-type domain-containing protein n=1 Tax=Vitis rotundifolia TaxID=103349 RepID=A0AA39DUT4_VITRO|nr:hypothetical protein PVL29_007480 [Vitis rotundifolia]
MDLPLASHPLPQLPSPPAPSPTPTPSPYPSLLIGFFSIFTAPLFIFLVVLTLCGCLKRFFRRRDGHQTPEPDIEIGATNLDHRPPSHDFSPSTHDDISQRPVEEKSMEEVAPSFVFDKSRAEEGGMKGNNECVICLEDIKDGEICRVLPECSHVFHKACVGSWLMKKRVCPICRLRVKDTVPNLD